MDPGVARQLRVERRRHHRTLPDRDDPTGGRSGGDPGEHVDTVTNRLHPRGADEHRVQMGTLAQGREV